MVAAFVGYRAEVVAGVVAAGIVVVAVVGVVVVAGAVDIEVVVDIEVLVSAPSAQRAVASCSEAAYHKGCNFETTVVLAHRHGVQGETL